ncbi:MAG: hypothetical protein AAFW00_20625 [Bacteroidota bacterium]
MLIFFAISKDALAQKSPLSHTEKSVSADRLQVVIAVKGDGQQLFLQNFEVDLHLIGEGSHEVECEVWRIKGILSNTCLRLSIDSESDEVLVISVDLNQTINFLSKESYFSPDRSPYHLEHFKKDKLTFDSQPFCLSYISYEAKKGNVLMGGSGVTTGCKLYIRKSQKGTCLEEVDSARADTDTYEGPEEVFKSFFENYGYDFQEVSYEIDFIQP